MVSCGVSRSCHGLRGFLEERGRVSGWHRDEEVSLAASAHAVYHMLLACQPRVTAAWWPCYVRLRERMWKSNTSVALAGCRRTLWLRDARCGK